MSLTARQRIALGQAQRKHMRRTDHAGWRSALRSEGPLELLAASMSGRVPALVHLKYDRMAATPFGFFRGAVPIMAADLALVAHTGIFTQLCGDAHVRNLGAFAAPDGRLVFDINDFDETIRGPFEWDIKRMAASLVLAGRETGAKNALCHDAAHAFLARYRTSMHAFARMPVLELARYMVHRLHAVQPVSQIMRLAERATPLHNLDTLTIPASKDAARATSELPPRDAAHARMFKTIPPDLARVHGSIARRVLDSLATYAECLLPERRHFFAQYTPLDVAFKIVGTGSVGLRDYCIYMQGNGGNDPLFLQIKEEVHSAYMPYLGEPLAPAHQGQRAVEGQRAMQFQSDPFLGWTTIEGRDYLVRQLNDHKASVPLGELKAAGLLEYAAVCGETLARGHARAGDPCRIAGYIGTSDRFDSAIAKFAAEYADQTERDWKALVRSRREAGGHMIGKPRPPVTPSAPAPSKQSEAVPSLAAISSRTQARRSTSKTAASATPDPKQKKPQKKKK